MDKEKDVCAKFDQTLNVVWLNGTMQFDQLENFILEHLCYVFNRFLTCGGLLFPPFELDFQVT